LAITGRGRLVLVGHINLLPLVYVAYLLGLTQRYILVLHGIEAWRKHHWIYRRATCHAFAVVATSKYTVREFCHLNGIPADLCVIIPLSSGSRPPDEARLAPGDTLRLLTVSRLSAADAYKGIDTILHALAQALTLGMNVTLDLVGDGDDRGRLVELAGMLHIDGMVRFHGSIPDEDVARLLRTSQVFVMPSKCEGFGIVFVEAMAAGLPCIGANHGGTPEVIEHGETGFLIEHGDVDQLLFYIRQLLDTPGLYQRMSDAARRRATTTLGRDAVARQWRQLLSAVHGTSASPRYESERPACR
jgi:glycosyltransferase involved in cell wall biosynthesis